MGEDITTTLLRPDEPKSFLVIPAFKLTA